MPQRKRTRGRREPEWMKAKTYEELKALTEDPSVKRTGQENWAIMERMRQLRYGYKPGELKMDKSAFRIYSSMEEFSAAKEREYGEEIRKYGPR